MVQVLRDYGYPFFSVVVLAESLGLPVPSSPLILIGAAAVSVPTSSVAEEQDNSWA